MKNFVVAMLVLVSLNALNAQKVSLRYNLKQGATYVTNQHVVQNIEQTIMGNSMTIKMTMDTRIKYVVNKIENGNFHLSMVHDGLKVVMESPMMNVEFDSAAENQDESNPMSKSFGAIVGQSYDLVITPTGKVLSVTGFDKVMDKILASVNGNQAMADEVAANIKQQFGEESIKTSIEMMTAIYPENPVSVGESWVVKGMIKSGMELNSESNYTLKSVANGQWNIEGVTTLVSNSDLAIPTNGMTSHFEMNGKSTQKVVVNATSGWLENVEMSQIIDGKVNIEGGQLPSPMEIPMKISAESKIVSI
jgi:hypothetical protein